MRCGDAALQRSCFHRLAQEQGVVQVRAGAGSTRDHLAHNVQELQSGMLAPAASRARAFYRCVAAIEQRICTLQRAQQRQLMRACTIAQALMRKADHGATHRTSHPKQKVGAQALLLAAAAAAVRIALMCKSMRKERMFAAMSKNSAALRLSRFLKSIRGVVHMKRQAHMRRVQALRQRCASVIAMFFKLFLPRMKRLRRARAAAVIAGSLREHHRGWGSHSVRQAMTNFLKKVRIVQKQARTFLSRAAANKRWLLWQFMKIEKAELLRVYGSGRKGNAALRPSDMSRLMMSNDARQAAIDALWKVLRRDFSNKYSQFQAQRAMHFVRMREMAVFRRGMLSFVGLNHAALNRLPADVRMDLLTAYNPPVPPSYKQCMRPGDDELLQIVRIAQYDSGRPLDPQARRGVSAYAKQRLKLGDNNRAEEQRLTRLETLNLETKE
jgi:hypothetical protein